MIVQPSSPLTGVAPEDHSALLKQAKQSATGGKRSYLLLLSSVSPSTNWMWCPDCVNVMPLVERVLGSSSSSEVFVQYVGQPQQWRSTSSPFRSTPYKISSIPSLLAFEDGKEVGRADEPALLRPGQLEKFVGSA